ncbi:hypothetical protein LSAT2_002436 [Lamellibrachia satsuma]|nr:hypothetical protein LSAT2_002436 [Lamellibrachia satsuma]
MTLSEAANYSLTGAVTGCRHRSRLLLRPTVETTQPQRPRNLIHITLIDSFVDGYTPNTCVSVFNGTRVSNSASVSCVRSDTWHASLAPYARTYVDSAICSTSVNVSCVVSDVTSSVSRSLHHVSVSLHVSSSDVRVTMSRRPLGSGISLVSSVSFRSTRVLAGCPDPHKSLNASLKTRLASSHQRCRQQLCLCCVHLVGWSICPGGM